MAATREKQTTPDPVKKDASDPIASSTLVEDANKQPPAAKEASAGGEQQSAPDGSRKSKKSSSKTTSPTSTPSPRSSPQQGTSSSPNAQAKKPKRSIWSSFRSLLLPCIPSTAGNKAHEIDVDQSVSAKTTVPAPGKEASDADKIKEKQLDEKHAPAQQQQEKSSSIPPSSTTTTGGPSATTTTTTGTTVHEGPVTPTKTKPPPLVTSAAVAASDSPVEQDGDVTVVIPPSPQSHLLPREETEGVTSGAVQPPGSTGGESHLLHPPHPHHHHPSTSAGTATITTDSDVSITDENEGDVADNEGDGKAGVGAAHDMDVEDEDDEEERLILQGGTGIPIGPDGKACPLLPPVATAHKGRKCLVLDLDETLLHSSFKLIPQADYVVPVEIEWQWHNVYVIKRPGVDNFLKKMGELYEIVIFTASLSKYADPVLDKLDVNKVVAHRLFRESCYNHKGNYVKDLSRLGRPVEDMIILDNSPASYIFHPNNAVPVSSWFNDPHDTELTDLCPFLADLMSVDDVRGVLDGGL